MLIKIQNIESRKVCMDNSFGIKPFYKVNYFIKKLSGALWWNLFEPGRAFCSAYKFQNKDMGHNCKRRRNPNPCITGNVQIPELALCPCKNNLPLVLAQPRVSGIVF